MQYQQLDIEADPGEQGFEKGTFDVIEAANVSTTLGRLRAHAILTFNI